MGRPDNLIEGVEIIFRHVSGCNPVNTPLLLKALLDTFVAVLPPDQVNRSALAGKTPSVIKAEPKSAGTRSWEVIATDIQ
jgi:hypothetical protein